MDKGRFVIETHLRTGRPIGELAKTYGLDRSWLYRRLDRYRREGPAGLEPRSKRPKRSPTRIADRYEERIVELRKALDDAGLDAGAATIHAHLAAAGPAPSISTIWRVLKTRGFVTPQPHKRPRSSWIRFEANLPNQLWQADVTHWALADGHHVEILNIIDDHSRTIIASRVFATTRGPDVVRTLQRAATTWGYPQSFLTDNGLIFTARHRHGLAGAFEEELFALGIEAKHSRPYHPQTCGKVERFHQTLKKYLAKQPPAATNKQLQRQIDRFATYYNTRRPHRALGRRTPAVVYYTRHKPTPTRPRIDTTGYRIRNDRVSTSGSVTLRHHGRLHHIGIGRAYAGWRIILLVAGPDIRILTQDGAPLHHLKLDPNHDYQPLP